MPQSNGTPNTAALLSDASLENGTPIKLDRISNPLFC
jgi:hypothetical protein